MFEGFLYVTVFLTRSNASVRRMRLLFASIAAKVQQYRTFFSRASSAPASPRGGARRPSPISFPARSRR